jgi:hypothetical protein
MRMILMRWSSPRKKSSSCLRVTAVRRLEGSMRDSQINSGGSLLMRLIRLSSARIARNTDIGRGTARMRLRELTVFYVVKILMTHFRVMLRHALNVIRWVMWHNNAVREILSNVECAD